MTNPPIHPTIIKETKHWVVVNKPAGMVVEGAKSGSPTVQSFIADHLQQTEKKPYVGIVHRLDRVTTGLVLLAKKKGALKLINEQFQKGVIKKSYLALSDKEPEQKEALLTHYLSQERDLKKTIVRDANYPKAKKCRLKYQQLASSDMGYHLFKVDLLTGRYHQIRAQLADIHCPIVGDEKYGSVAAYYHREIALHAWQLQFEDPIEKVPVLVSATPPVNPFWNDFKNILVSFQ